MKFTRRKEVKQKIVSAMNSTQDFAKTLDRDFIGEEWCRRNGIDVNVYRAFVRHKKKKQIAEYSRRKRLYDGKDVHTMRKAVCGVSENARKDAESADDCTDTIAEER